MKKYLGCVSLGALLLWVGACDERSLLPSEFSKDLRPCTNPSFSMSRDAKLDRSHPEIFLTSRVVDIPERFVVTLKQGDVKSNLGEWASAKDSGFIVKFSREDVASFIPGTVEVVVFDRNVSCSERFELYLPEINETPAL